MQDRKQLNKEHNRRVKKFVSMIEKIFEVSNQEAIKMAESVNYDSSKIFKFADYPELKTKINKFVREFQKQIKTTIVNGITAEWGESNFNNDELVRLILGNNLNGTNKTYFNNHEKALQAFIDRKTKGMNLSERVWRLSKQYKENLEQALSVGISDGKSAVDLSIDVREYLNEPKKLFRRVRDLEGNLQLSKNAKEYNPGNGVYRSSFKNALRLTRTEINMAYRKADSLRWQDLDFVIGIEIKLSDNHTIINPKTGEAEPFYDICDELQGKYPKTFVFTGWHPQCRCYVIPILKSQKELFDKNNSNKNEIKDVPDSFKEWIKNNEERISKAKSIPYFIRDNKSFVASVNNEINPLFKNVTVYYKDKIMYRGDIRDKGEKFKIDFKDYVSDNEAKNKAGFHWFTTSKEYAKEYATKQMNAMRGNIEKSIITEIKPIKELAILDLTKMKLKDEFEFSKSLYDYGIKGLMYKEETLSNYTGDYSKKSVEKYLGYNIGNSILNNGQIYSDGSLGVKFMEWLKENGFNGYKFQQYKSGDEIGLIDASLFEVLKRNIISN
ncbi:MAG: hypothetical protein ACK5MH_09005 [Bacteroidales bacterium]